MTLHELTGWHESGIILKDKTAVVYYWANSIYAEDNYLPFVSPMGNDLIWMRTTENFDDAIVSEVEDWRELITIDDLDYVFDPNNDLACMNDDRNESDYHARVYDLYEELRIIVPDNWN